MTIITDLVAALSPRVEELRRLGETPVAVCGSRGGIFEDGEVRLALSRLSPDAKAAAVELVDANVFRVSDDGKVWLNRLPVDSETPLIRKALGLHSPRYTS